MGQRLNRQLGAPANMIAGEHCRDAGLVLICCPLCGTVTPLDDTKHIVSRDGKVTPAWSCPACPAHEWIELEP